MKYQACWYTNTQGRIVHCIVDGKGNIVSHYYIKDRATALKIAKEMNEEGV